MYDIASSVLDAAGALLTSTGGERRELDPDIVKPGWVALGIFVAMAVALALLMWSFARVSRRARQPWEGDEPGSTDETSGDRAGIDREA